MRVRETRLLRLHRHSLLTLPKVRGKKMKATLLRVGKPIEIIGLPYAYGAKKQGVLFAHIAKTQNEVNAA